MAEVWRVRRSKENERKRRDVWQICAAKGVTSLSNGSEGSAAVGKVVAEDVAGASAYCRGIRSSTPRSPDSCLRTTQGSFPLV